MQTTGGVNPQTFPWMLTIYDIIPTELPVDVDYKWQIVPTEVFIDVDYRQYRTSVRTFLLTEHSFYCQP